MKRNDIMNLESLPNEILLEIFEYLTGLKSFFKDFMVSMVALIAFFTIIFRSYRLYFSSCLKHQFDMICQQHLPFLADRVIALDLSDCHDTPGQIDLFFSYIPSLSPFIRLRTLNVSSIHSYLQLTKLLMNYIIFTV